MATKTYRGSCHCGAVRFEADVDLSGGTNRCNCSICFKARSWFVLVKPDRVRLLSGAGAQTEYEWVAAGRPASFLHYRFCGTCGIRTFGRAGQGPDGNDFVFVNVAALDVDRNELAAAPLRFVDGLHDRFDRAPDDTRLL